MPANGALVMDMLTIIGAAVAGVRERDLVAVLADACSAGAST